MRALRLLWSISCSLGLLSTLQCSKGGDSEVCNAPDEIQYSFAAESPPGDGCKAIPNPDGGYDPSAVYHLDCKATLTTCDSTNHAPLTCTCQYGNIVGVDAAYAWACIQSL